MRLGGTQSRFGCGGEQKNPQPPLGLEPLIIQPVAQRNTTELLPLLTSLLKILSLFEMSFVNDL
jgi:hypothetical protein